MSSFFFLFAVAVHFLMFILSAHPLFQCIWFCTFFLLPRSKYAVKFYIRCILCTRWFVHLKSWSILCDIMRRGGVQGRLFLNTKKADSKKDRNTSKVPQRSNNQNCKVTTKALKLISILHFITIKNTRIELLITPILLHCIQILVCLQKYYPISSAAHYQEWQKQQVPEDELCGASHTEKRDNILSLICNLTFILLAYSGWIISFTETRFHILSLAWSFS